MLAVFADCVHHLAACKPRVPLVYTTAADIRKCERIDRAIGWLVVVDHFLRACERRAADARHRAAMARKRERAALARQAALADMAEHGTHDELTGARLGHAGQGLSRLLVRDASTGAVKRLAHIDFAGGAVEIATRPEYDPRSPRYAQAFPQARTFAPQPPAADWRDLAQLPGWAPLPEALEPLLAPEEDVANHTELRSKEVIPAENDLVAAFLPDDTCATCKRSEALCTCHAGFRPDNAESDKDELDYAGFASDLTDRYIRMQGELVERRGQLAEARWSIGANERAVAGLEADRPAPRSDEDALRLAEIQKATLAIAQAERAIWVLGRQIEELEAKLALLEELDAAEEADFEDLEYRNLRAA